MKKKFLIIGSNSFSGSSFVNHLLSLNYQVVGVSRSEEPNSIFLPYKKNANIKRFKFFKININKDIKKFRQILIKEKPAYIINYAAQGMVAESWVNPIDWYQTNVISQVKIFEILKDMKFIKRYLHFTTPEVYGTTKKWVKESYNFSPSTPYAVSRATSDFHLLNMYKVYKFPIIFTRTANVYGPYQQLYRIIPKALGKFKLDEKLPLHGGGNSERSFIYITDVNTAVYKLLFKGKLGETYHISTNEIISIKNLIKKIALLSGIDFKKNVIIESERLGKDKSYILSTLKITKAINWSPKIDLDKGLQLTNKWIDNNFKKIKSMNFNYRHKK